MFGGLLRGLANRNAGPRRNKIQRQREECGVGGGSGFHVLVNFLVL